jgi:N-acetylglucosaminyldiphosphoundecaprenol N-acetyl-beta-D-mannosaminyltransferase
MVRPAEVGSACTPPVTVELLGYPIVSGKREEVLDLLWRRLQTRECTHLVTLNPEMIVRARRDRQAANALRRADMFVADGVGVVWAAGMLKRQGIERYPGIDLAMDLIQRMAQQNMSIFLLGAKEGVAERAAERLAQVAPGLSIAGTQHGYFETSEESAIAANIAQAQPDMLLVGMGYPKQEMFIGSYRGQLHVPLMIGAGGALEVIAGDKRRAPRWMQRAGMEWAYRSMADLSRYKRLGVLPAFIGLVLRETMGEVG